MELKCTNLNHNQLDPVYHLYTNIYIFFFSGGGGGGGGKGLHRYSAIKTSTKLIYMIQMVLVVFNMGTVLFPFIFNRLIQYS